MATLYESIKSLCEENGVKPSRMCVDLDISKSMMTKLKNGTKQSVQVETAQKIANYFGVSVDRVLGTEEKTTPGNGSGLEEKYVKYLNFILDASERDLAIIDAMIEAKKKETEK